MPDGTATYADRLLLNYSEDAVQIKFTKVSRMLSRRSARVAMLTDIINITSLHIDCFKDE